MKHQPRHHLAFATLRLEGGLFLPDQLELVFDLIREPAPVFRVGGDILTGQTPVLIKLRP